MDIMKRNRSVRRLAAEPEPQLVPIEEFFDGNDDLGSIGCNLPEHPGIAVFRDILVGLTLRPDVEAATHGFPSSTRDRTVGRSSTSSWSWARSPPSSSSKR
jgi:hypothetical protein